MADKRRLTWPVKREDDFLRIVAYITIATVLIFVIDISTPLGVMIWILYLIPLFLTVYLSWKYAPLVMTGVFALLIVISFFLSPRDMSVEYVIIDRVFFVLVLVVASFFIKDYISNVEDLVSSEERYRSLIEWLPEGIVVYREGAIAYVNPAGTRLLGADLGEDLTGRDIISMIDPEFQALFRQRVAQAALGARMNIDNVRILRQDKREVTVDIYLGAVFWGNGAAVQIVMRNS
ncbi:MAG: PAS domain S-box protein [Methanoregula sp.]